ncbi:MAG: peptidoglycan-binding protein LysM [Gelidibacter sp.]|nr:peptidoglycan-binding protein LysM [Gelidibacter sp.]
MIKKITSYFVIPMVICIGIVLGLNPEQAVDMTNYSTKGLTLNYTVSKDVAMLDNSKEEPLQEYVHTNFIPVLGKAYLGFKEAVAFKESRGNYRAVNDFGYLGKYQFGVETLKTLGIHNPDYFLNTPELQEKAFLANAERNKWILRKDISRFVGKTINGVQITESGILAAAHLAGAGSVKKFLRSYGSERFSDAFGSSITYYMKKFSGYDTSYISANKNAKVRA